MIMRKQFVKKIKNCFKYFKVSSHRTQDLSRPTCLQPSHSPIKNYFIKPIFL